MSDLTDRIQEYLREQEEETKETDTQLPDVSESIEMIGLELLALAGELYAASKVFVRIGERALEVSRRYPK